jgi:hypothetical protein
MNRIGRGVAILLLGLPGSSAAQQAPEQTATTAERYRTLLKAQEAASSPGRILSDEERLQFIGGTFRRWNAIALKFVDLAEKDPNDPVAVDVLIRAVWQVNSTPWPVELAGPDDARARAFALLQRDQIRSDRLGPVCERISGGFCQEYETFLRAVLEKNPHRAVRAQACVGLALFLSNRLARLDLIKDQPRLLEEFAGLFGRGYLDELSRQDGARAMAEAEALFERAARDYGDVKMPHGGTVAERAGAELFEIHNLVAGKEAPEMEGEDQDGRRFKLSDYCGRVVLIDFWSEY